MAFPTTSVLDTCQSGSTVSTNFTTPALGGGTAGQTNGVGLNTLSGSPGIYWNASSFGPDAECYVTSTTFSTFAGVYVRITNPGSGSYTAYNFFPEIGIRKTVSGSTTTLQSTTQAISSGDSYGISAVGTTITSWYKAAAGSWVQVGTVTDSSISGSGFIGLDYANGNVLHHFGGGTVVVAPANTVAPVASGSTTLGSVVTTTDGTWTGFPAPTFTYQWQRDVLGNGVYSNIATATANSYTLTLLDDACNVRCTVTGTNTAGSATANSNSILDTTPVPGSAPTGALMSLLGAG